MNAREKLIFLYGLYTAGKTTKNANENFFSMFLTLVEDEFPIFERRINDERIQKEEKSNES